MRVNPMQVVFVALHAIGVLLWVLALARGRALEWFNRPARMPAWVVSITEFLVFAVVLGVSTLMAAYAAAWMFGLPAKPEAPTARSALITGSAMQLAWLATAAAFHALRIIRPEPGSMRNRAAAIGGAGALLLALPAVSAANLGWNWLLHRLDVPVQSQSAIEFVRNATTFGALLPWVLLVAVIVPVAEELVFRRGLYRFLAGHLPDAVAVVVSSILFAALHGNLRSFVPLGVLGVALCLAYRQTGRVITPIVMHAGFNLLNLLQARFGSTP